MLRAAAGKRTRKNSVWDCLGEEQGRTGIGAYSIMFGSDLWSAGHRVPVQLAFHIGLHLSMWNPRLPLLQQQKGTKLLKAAFASPSYVGLTLNFKG